MAFSSPGGRVCRSLFVLAGLALAASGCGPAKAKISGLVKYNGEPLPSGTITFQSDAGDKPVKGTSIVDGKYTISDFPVGPAKISVITLPPATGGAPPTGSAIQGPGSSMAPVTPDKYVPIPKKYGNPGTSGLTYDVKAGDQTKDFDLTP